MPVRRRVERPRDDGRAAGRALELRAVADRPDERDGLVEVFDAERDAPARELELDVRGRGGAADGRDAIRAAYPCATTCTSVTRRSGPSGLVGCPAPESWGQSRGVRVVGS